MPRKKSKKKRELIPSPEMQRTKEQVHDAFDDIIAGVVGEHQKSFAFLYKAGALKKGDPIGDYFRHYATPFMNDLSGALQEIFTEVWLSI